MTPRAVLMKTGPKPLNTARPVKTDHPKTTVYRARSMSCFSKLAQSPVKRPYQSRTTLTNKNSNKKVNIAKEKVYTAKPKAVNTARPTSAVVNAVRANQVNVIKASTCWVWRPIKLNSASITFKRQNYIDARGRSKVIHKKKIKDMLIVDALGTRQATCHISQTSRNLIGDMLPLGEELEEEELLMCDKKNCALFTDTVCFVLSPDFKLPDESQVLLKVPRKNNMYSVDMKNIVPKESLTCLVAKATLDESMLWHRRLGHINFKTINKLVKDNLVRGLHAKRFENDQTCVACLKGKQHKASYSLRTKFKNRVMNEFYEKKGIKREFSVARTPQQNGVAERRNRTLIEAARTMLANSKLPTTFWAEALNTACYVQNRFDEKSDDGFLCDGPRWLFDNDSLTKSMNYVPVVAGTNSNDFAGSKESNGAGHTSKETELSQDYIVMPLRKDGSMFDSSSKNSSDDEPQHSSNAEKKDDEGVSKASGFSDQEQPESSTPNTNTVGPSINTVSVNFMTGSLNINTVSPIVFTTRSNRSQNVSDMFSLGRSATLEATHADLFGKRAIGTKWIFKKKKDKRGIVTRNEARLVSQGYTQEEGIDYDEVFAPVARIEAIRLFLAYALFMGFMVYQMDGFIWNFGSIFFGNVNLVYVDVKSALLYGTIEEEVYVCQPPGFEDLDYPDKVYMVVKALYGLH
ncbi:ribonuclease H-like domain-containing protein [Tanacetum coccineum]